MAAVMSIFMVLLNLQFAALSAAVTQTESKALRTFFSQIFSLLSLLLLSNLTKPSVTGFPLFPNSALLQQSLPGMSLHY